MSDFFRPEDFLPPAYPTALREMYVGYSKHFSDAANRILAERGVVVYGEMPHGCPNGFSTIRTPHGMELATHTALLVNIQPIAKDSAESLLREVRELLPDKEELKGLLERMDRLENKGEK